ncbi:hypothetical protein FDA94_18960 [Herbidospora galbida]|uniref:Uncharacterized protein n=1 Tax=Herbidospora galbida TaxID=2575442 RepID=A0A4U3MH75_9ACTN|nr:hypothetical protein [Herbidospora galbida]TKK87196.1 hypothetical protein FDA94_18960 [Herbidospora galbida]
MIVGTIVTICVIAAGSAAAASDPPVRYTGEELFSGLLLSQGPAAETYADLRGPHSNVVWTAAEASRLTGRIKALDPRFFASFKADVTSGDRVRVHRAANRAGELAVKAYGAGALSEAAPASPGLAKFVVVNRTIMKQTSVVVNQNKYWSGPDPSASKLDHERWADEVADRLAP